MNYDVFLTRIIDDGIAAAKHDYPEGSDKLLGSVEGFEACRGKQPLEILKLLQKANEATMDAFRRDASDYWRVRCFEAEVGWVANVVSAVLLNEGLPTIVNPTARGAMKAAEIVGVRQPN